MATPRGPSSRASPGKRAGPRDTSSAPPQAATPFKPGSPSWAPLCWWLEAWDRGGGGLPPHSSSGRSGGGHEHCCSPWASLPGSIGNETSSCAGQMLPHSRFETLPIPLPHELVPEQINSQFKHQGGVALSGPGTSSWRGRGHGRWPGEPAPREPATTGTLCLGAVGSRCPASTLLGLQALGFSPPGPPSPSLLAHPLKIVPSFSPTTPSCRPPSLMGAAWFSHLLRPSRGGRLYL